MFEWSRGEIVLLYFFPEYTTREEWEFKVTTWGDILVLVIVADAMVQGECGNGGMKAWPPLTYISPRLISLDTFLSTYGFSFEYTILSLRLDLREDLSMAYG